MVGIVHQMTFPAGSGAMPPVLAGRKAEQEELAWHLGFCAPAKRDRILFGPRGNGKTCLRCWLERQAVGDAVEVIG